MMPETLKHAKVRTITERPDGSAHIKTESYYEELNSVKQEIQQSIKTSKDTFIADLMRCVAPISDGSSREVNIHIEANERNEPCRIVKTWTVDKKFFGR